MSDDDLREVARAELTGYWSWAARHCGSTPHDRPRPYIDGSRPTHPRDRRAADQESCHRAGRPTRLAARPDACEASRGGRDLSSTTHSPHRLV